MVGSLLIAGTDAHAKNYSLLLAGNQIRLAPLYDIASILPYDDSDGHKVKLAMKVGDDYKLRRAAGDARLATQRLVHRGVELSVVATGCRKAPDPPPGIEDDVSIRRALASDVVRPLGIEPRTCGLSGRQFLSGEDRPVRGAGVLSKLLTGQSEPYR